MNTPTGFRTCRLPVAPDWIDYNGHMNVGYYVVAFDRASDALLDHLDLGEAYRRRADASVFVVEAHVTYDREVREGDPLLFETILLNADAKRLHFIHRMYHETEGFLAATNEIMGLHVDLNARRSAPFPGEVAAGITAMVEAHSGVERPPQVGRLIGIPAPRA
jgi:acyl-CoA thioester hydrolase